MPGHLVSCHISNKKELLKLAKKDLMLYPPDFNLLDFTYNNLYHPTEASIDYLETEIEKNRRELGGIKKQHFFVEKFIIPDLTNSQYSSTNEVILAGHLAETLDSLACLLDKSLQYLQDDLCSKKNQLKKRKERRRRYKNNKKENAWNTNCGEND